MTQIPYCITGRTIILCLVLTLVGCSEAQPGSVQGRLLLPNGRPLSGMPFSCKSQRPSLPRGTTLEVPVATGVQGEYGCSGTSGRYTLEVIIGPDRTWSTQIDVPAGETVTKDIVVDF